MLTHDGVVIGLLDGVFEVRDFVSPRDDEERRVGSDALVSVHRNADLLYASWIRALADNVKCLGDNCERLVEGLNPLVDRSNTASFWARRICRSVRSLIEPGVDGAERLIRRRAGWVGRGRSFTNLAGRTDFKRSSSASCATGR